MNREMTFERFDELAMAYGGTLARWPDDARREGEAFLAAYPDAARILADAQALDSALSGLEPAPAPSDALMARILGDAADVAADNAAAAVAARPAAQTVKPRRKASFGAIFGGLPRWAPGLAFAASLALGVGIGASERVEIAPAEAVLALVAPPDDGAMDVAFVFDDGGEFDPFLGGEASL